MKTILFLSSELPYPPHSGGRLKSWKLVEFLHCHYRLCIGCILKGNDPENVPLFIDRLQAAGAGKQPAGFFSEVVRVPRNARTLATSYLKGMPLNLYRTFSAAFAEQVRRQAKSADLILADHYEVFQHLPPDFPGPVLLHTHNAEYVMWQRYARSPGHPAKRLAALMESFRIRRSERKACQRADLILAAPNDIDNFVRIGVDRNKCRVTYHLGDDTQLRLPPLRFEETEAALMTMGSLDWEANVDGLLWFLGHVWPLLKQRRPGLKFFILGKNADPRLTAAASADPGIDFPGFVADPEPYFQRARIFVAPLRFGSGIKVKVLNAMCRGIPCVTTSVGVEGLAARHMKHLAVVDPPRKMAGVIEDLLADREAWQRLATESRQLIASRYTWQKLFEETGQILDTCLARRPAARVRDES